MSGTVEANEASAGSGAARSVTWVRRSEVPPFSPAPGIQIQPVIGESLMTCWITMEPGAIVAEHSHANEQLGVVVEGSVSLTVAGETRQLEVGDAYLVPSDLPHNGVAGEDGVLLVETFVPIREEYAKAWRAIAERINIRVALPVAPLSGTIRIGPIAPDCSVSPPVVNARRDEVSRSMTSHLQMPAPISGEEVRRRFVEFFTERGHREVPSSSLVPHNDPTVLLTTAGMQQMTPYFMGLEQPPAQRMVSVQKCFRTVDIDEVGDESHCTFFFMLGNFSVGDYFKRESLEWSWEFLTRTRYPADRLFPTVHPDDQDALRIWREVIGIPDDRIGRLEDNWWGPVGATGPNGPDSEIYFDRGPEHGCGTPDCAPGCDCERYLEVWNNVFMEFVQLPDGTRTPLPGSMSIPAWASSGWSWSCSRWSRSTTSTSIRRSSSMWPGWPASPTGRPGNRPGATHHRRPCAGRYVPDRGRGAARERRPVLRAAPHPAPRDPGWPQTWARGAFLAAVAGVVIDQFAHHHRELTDRRVQIEKVLAHEEESFGRTLSAGMARFQALVEELARDAVAQGETVARVLPGREVFRLYDTYGFPFDLTVELAREQGLEVDQVGFEEALAAQREISRGGAVDAFRDRSRSRAEVYVELAQGPTEFLGYEAIAADARILGLVGADGPVVEAEAGDAVEVIWTAPCSTASRAGRSGTPAGFAPTPG